MSNQGDNDGRPADDVLGRADALLNRHRAAVAPAADPRDIPTLTEAVAGNLDTAAIPTLTDIVAPPLQTPPAASVLMVPDSSPPSSRVILP